MFRFFSICINIYLRILHESAYWVGVYTPKQSRIGHCIYFLTDYIQSNFVFNIAVPRQYLYFFDSGRIRIFVFYMGAQTE